MTALTTENHPSVVNKAALDLQDKLVRLLAKAKPSKREQIQGLVRDLYPTLEEHRFRGKSHKDLLAAFNAISESNTCLRTFKELLEQERGRRDECGLSVCCAACGQHLNVDSTKRLLASTESAANESSAFGTATYSSNPPESE